MPWKSEEPIRLLVKLIRAVMPLTAGAVSAWCSATASGSRLGDGA